MSRRTPVAVTAGTGDEADVAERLGVSQPTYAECERVSNIRIGTLQKIVAALGGELSFHVLIGGRDYNLQMPQPV